MSFKPIDSRRDEFRKYLERSGVIDEFTKVLIKLFNTQERPENAIQFIFDNLGHSLLQKDQYECLKKELEDSRNEITELKNIIEKLQADSKVVNHDSISSIEPLVEIKQEHVKTETLEQNDEVSGSVDKKVSSPSAQIHQNFQEDNVTSTKLEEKNESLVDGENVENSENSISLPDTGSNIVEVSGQKESVEEKDAKNSENISEKQNIPETDAKNNEEVASASNVKTEISEISTKGNTETIISTDPQESTNTEKPAEDNKENKEVEEKK